MSGARLRRCPGADSLPLYRRTCPGCGARWYALTASVAQQYPDAKCPTCKARLGPDSEPECVECEALGAHRRAA